MVSEILSYAVRPRVVAVHFGQLLFVVGCAGVPPAICALVFREWPQVAAYLLIAAILAGVGWLLQRSARAADMQWNEALVTVAAIFVATPLVFALPMTLTGLGYSDALFEAISGITTTGLSTFDSVEDKSRTTIFTAAWLQWLGGIGIIVLSFALLFGQGASAKRLTGALSVQLGLLGGTRAYALLAIRIYAGLTVLGIALIWLSGADPFSAVALALSAVSTGGFSPFDASIGGLGGLTQLLVIMLCALGAIALPIHYDALRGKWRTVLRDSELRALVLLGLAIAAVLVLRQASVDGHAERAWWQLVLMGFSAQTTAGFTSISPEGLDGLSKGALIVAMAVGGGVGSSAGGMKLLRLIVMMRLAWYLIVRTGLTPHATVSTRIAGREWSDRELVLVLVILGLFVAVILASWLFFLAFGYDALDALFEVVSATGTVGMSTGITRAALEPALKAVLCVDMLLGRLEIVALLVVVFPGTWFGHRQVLPASGEDKGER